MTRLIMPLLLLVFALTGCGESSRVTSSGSTVGSITLVSISVGPPDTTVALGITAQFSATGVYSDGSKSSVSSAVTWTSSASTVATVSNAIGTSGIATPVAAGTTTITATLGGIKGSTTLTVSPAVLVSIAVTPAATTVPAGTQTQFTATGTYSDETTKNITGSVTWSSSTVGVATINATGLATTVGAGSTTITATLNSISGSTTLAVTADTLLSIAVTPATASIANGTSQQFVATGTYTNGTTQTTQNITTSVTWSSSNAAVAAVNTTGLAKSATVGSVTITAKLGTISGTATLTVTPATLVSVSVTPANPSIAKGTHEQFVATGTYTDGTTQILTTTAVWVSSAPTVASVSNTPGSDGYAAGLGVGTSIISATVSGIAGSTTLTVTPATLVTISVTPTNSSVALGFFAQFTATGIYTDNTTQDLTTSVLWTSSTGAAVISNGAPTQGRASALNVGTTTITATLTTPGSPTVSGLTTLHVTAAALQTIVVTPAAPSIVVGSTEMFTATGFYSDNSQQDLTASVTWTSGTTAVATISNASPTIGYATAVAAGTSLIEAALGTVNGTTTLTVTPATLTSITVSPANPSIAVGTSQQFTATGHYSNNTTQDLTTTVTWSSSSAAATISNAAGSNGLATGASQGTATITATLGAVSGSTTLDVTAAVLVSIAVTPANAVISVGLTQQYVATGTYTDNTTQVLTASAAWSSSIGTVAAISSAAATAGLATATAAGTTQIVATVGAIASPGVTLTVKPATYAYVTNASGSSISQYVVGLNGVLTPQATPTLTGGYNYPFAIVVDPTNTYAYMADFGKQGSVIGNGRIFQYLIGSNGSLTPLNPAYVSTGYGSGPNSVTLDPAGKNLYVADNSIGFVDQYAIDPTLGTLTLAQHLSVGGAPVTVKFRPDGKYAYVSNQASTGAVANTVLQFSVDPSTGNLTALAPASVAGGAGPQGMAVDPTGTYLFATDTSSGANPVVAEFTVGAAGLLAPNGSASVVATQPIAITFDLTGTYVYVASQNSNGVNGLAQFKLAANGTLTPLTPAQLNVPNATHDVAIDPTNHYAYVTVRSNPGVILIYSISADGTLVPASNPSVAAGAGSTSLATTH